MGLLKQTQQQYYGATKSFTGDGTTTVFTISTTFNKFPEDFSITGDVNPNVKVYIDGVLYAQSFLSST